MIPTIKVSGKDFFCNEKTLAELEHVPGQPTKIVKLYDITETGAIRFKTLKDRDAFFTNIGLDTIYGPFYIDELRSMQYESSAMTILNAQFGDSSYSIGFYKKFFNNEEGSKEDE